MINELKRKADENRRVLASMEKSIAAAPAGRLRIAKHNQFYIREEKKGRWKYLKKNESETARKIAQREYDQVLADWIRKELYHIDTLLNFEKRNPIGTLYKSMGDDRKKLVFCRETTSDMKVSKWKAVEYRKKYFAPDEPHYETKSGEFVRSKSEMLIANFLHDSNVPYRYEYPVVMDDRYTVHPDFMIMNVRTGTEIIWEHMGLLDDAEYMSKAMRKIVDYSRNGYVLGKNLVISFECRGCPLSMSYLKAVVDAVCR